MHHEGVDRFHVAQICLNGHIITASITDNAAAMSKFCRTCGSATITRCPKCNIEIRGYLDRPGAWTFANMKLPAYCHNCGSAYQWTETQLEAVHNLINGIEGISFEDKGILNRSIDELINDTLQTELAAIRFKKIMAKVDRETVDACKKMLLNIIGEAARKLLWP
jgi:hypothetical protein